METDWAFASKLRDDETKKDEATRLLSREARNDLANILNLDGPESGPECEMMLREVTRALSMFPSMHKVVDRAPRGSRRLKSLAAIRSDAAHLLARLVDPRDPTLGDLAIIGFHPVMDRDPLVEGLAWLIEAAEALERGLRQREKRHPSRHGPPALARKRLVRRLADIFERYYRDQGDGLRSEKLQVDFVATALRAVGVHHPALRYDTAARSRLVREIAELRLAGTPSLGEEILAWLRARQAEAPSRPVVTPTREDDAPDFERRRERLPSRKEREALKAKMAEVVPGSPPPSGKVPLGV